MQTLVEIGPSNDSQGQHRRKDATEQMNLTLVRTRTQVLGCLVPMLYPMSYGCQGQNLNFNPKCLQILNSLRCLPFMWNFLDMLLLSVFQNLSTADFIVKYSSSYNYTSFLINVAVKICKTLTKLAHPTLRKGSIEERTQRNK